MLTKIDALPPGEVAYLLRHHLGPLRAWTHFLSDNIRKRQDIAGFTLTPVVEVLDGRKFRPWYRGRDVVQFIKDVQGAIPSARPKRAHAVSVVADLSKSRSLNRFDKAGVPACKHYRRSAGPHISTHHYVVMSTGAAVLPPPSKKFTILDAASFTTV